MLDQEFILQTKSQEYTMKGKYLARRARRQFFVFQLQDRRGCLGELLRRGPWLKYRKIYKLLKERDDVGDGL